MFAQTWQTTIVLVVALVAGAAGPNPISRPRAALGSPATRSGIGDAPVHRRTDLKGVHYAYLTRADPRARTVTFDLVAWYWGAAAKRACRQDRQPPSDTEWCNDYYYRNRSHRLRTVSVARNLSLDRLAGRTRPFRIRFSGGIVTRLSEVYIP